MTNTIVSGSTPIIALPRTNFVRQWMLLHKVPAVGIGLVNSGKIIAKVYGELSKGIPAPQNAVWGSKALADMVTILSSINGVDGSPPVNLFSKLNMQDTAFGDPIAVLNRMVRPHNKRDGIYVFKPYDTEGHLFTTVNDLCKLLAYINRQPDVVSRLTAIARIGEEHSCNLTRDQKGIIIRSMGNGASHTLLLLPQYKQAAVIFTNSDNGDMVEKCILESYGIDLNPISEKI
ncbi:hypothetical protein ACFGVR_00060 [Mucilaginibacter sp. AW1-3]